MNLRVATYNLKDFFEPRSDDEGPIVERKIANVAALLRQANADVVAFQEVGSEALMDRLCRVELRELGYDTLQIGPPDRRGIGNAIATRLPVLKKDVVVAGSLSFPRFAVTDPEPYASVPLRRAVVHVTVDAGELGPVDLFTIHFKSRLAAALKDEQGEAVRDASARAIGEAHLRAFVMRSAEALHVRSLVDALLDADPNRNVIVLGDFNDKLYALPTRVVRGAFPYVDPRRVLASATDGLPHEQRFSVLHGGYGDLIDHVLVSPGLSRRLLGAEILNATLRDHGPYIPDSPIQPDSDHAPVLAWFGF